jgi:hypothetical protein
VQEYDHYSKRSGKSERRFRVNYRDATGRQCCKVFITKRDVVGFERQLIVKKETGTLQNRKARRKLSGRSGTSCTSRPTTPIRGERT